MKLYFQSWVYPAHGGVADSWQLAQSQLPHVCRHLFPAPHVVLGLCWPMLFQLCSIPWIYRVCTEPVTIYVYNSQEEAETKYEGLAVAFYATNLIKDIADCTSSTT